MTYLTSTPPKRDTKRELQHVKRIMEQASEHDIDFAVEVDVDMFQPFEAFMSKYGLFYTQVTLDQISELCHELIKPVMIMKNTHKVDRPYVMASKLNMKLPHTHTYSITGRGYSYPSGHAALSRCVAHSIYRIFEDELDEEAQTELYALADDIANTRLVLGVHYPSDLEEGKRIADEFFSKI